MSGIRESVHCLFCASPCSPTFAVIEGKLIRVKTEVPNDDNEQGSSPTLQFLDRKLPLIENQLQVIFILKRILNFEDEKLAQFLGKVGGQLDPEFWVRLCKSCENLVREYYETFKKDLELQRKMRSISIKLKDRIEETREVHEAMEEEEGESPAVQIWKDVREAVLNQNGTQNDVDVGARPTPTANTIFNKIGDNSAEILMDGDIRAEWYGEEGTLHLDVPDLSTLKEILGLDFELGSGKASSQKVFIQDKQLPINKQREDYKQSQSQSESRASLITRTKTTPANSKTTTASAQSKPSLRQQGKNNKNTIPIPDGYMRYGDRILRKLTCEQCPYFTSNIHYLRRHRNLHQPGPKSSKVITCPICSWVLISSRFAAHNDLYHPSSNLENQKGQARNEILRDDNKRYYKCPDCGALCGSLVKLRGDHQNLHESGKGVNCTECGWLTYNLKTHMMNWHPQEGTAQARLRKRTASYPIIEVKKVVDEDFELASQSGHEQTSSSPTEPSSPLQKMPVNGKYEDYNGSFNKNRREDEEYDHDLLVDPPI